MLDVLPSFSLSCYCIQFWDFLVLGYFLVWPYCPYVVCIDVAVLAVLWLRGTPWFPYRRYAGNPTFNQLNKVSPPLGHWNPKCTVRRKGTVPITGNGHRPEERFSFSGTPLAVTGSLSAALFTAEPPGDVLAYAVHALKGSSFF